MDIRPIRVTDLGEMHAVGVKVFGPIAHSSLVIRQFFDLHHPHIFAAYDPAIRAYCMGGIEAGGETGHIFSLAVDPEARRQRLGFLLTERVMQALTRDGVKELRLVVSPSNSGAIDLYLKLGFQKEIVVKDYFGPGADRLMMSRAV